METGKNSSEFIPLFDKREAQKCHLALCIYDDSIRIGISHLVSKRHLYLKEFKINSWQNDLEPFFEFEFEKAHFKRVSACAMNSKNLVVPTALFDDSTIENVYGLSFKQKRGQKLLFEKIKILNAFNVYPKIKGLEEGLISSFKNFKNTHYYSIILESLSRETKNSEEDRMYIHFNSSSFDLFIFSRDKLQLSNNFQFRNAEDMIYYILNALEHLDISRDKCPVFLMGEIENNDNSFLALRNYFSELIFMKSDPKYSFGEVSIENPHKDYVLFNQVVCG
ncbi:MAG: DUF3822 family protein [Bacteroidota bacterium]